jgi:hypothetical protein
MVESVKVREALVATREALSHNHAGESLSASP